MNKLRAFIRYDGKGELVSSSLIVMQKKPAVGDWVEVPMHKTSNISPQLHTPFYRAMIRYDAKNNIVPGTLIITRSVPSIGNWYEVPMKKQASSTTTSTTTVTPITTTTTTTSAPFFMMKFDTLANADLTVGGDATDVADWNTFFDLPTNGTPFDNIQVVGTAPTEITLYGGGNMTLIDNLFTTNVPTSSCLLEIEDNNVVVACGNNVFGDLTGLGCYSLSSIILNSCLSIGEYTFVDCMGLSIIQMNDLLHIGEQSFYYCPLVMNFIFPNVLTIGDTTFAYCNPVIFNLPSCTQLGTSVLVNNVFQSITGKTITITIPHALESDGDIVWLKANNTVTVNYSD